MADTITIKDVELFSTGVHEGDTYSLGDLQGMARAARETGFDAPVILESESGDGAERLLKPESMPSCGWIRNVRVRAGKLIGDLTQVPRRAADAIRCGDFTRLATEIYHNFSQDGRTWPKVLRGITLIGAEVPPIRTLADVESLYAVQPMDGQGELKTYQAQILVTPVTWGSPESHGGWTGGNGEYARRNNERFRMAWERKHARAADEAAKPEAPKPCAPCNDKAMPPVAEYEAMEESGGEVVVGQFVDAWVKSYCADHAGASYEQGLKAFFAANPGDARVYLQQAAPDQRRTIAGSIARYYDVPGAVAGLTDFPGTGYRIEPRGAGPDRFVVFQGEAELASFNTEAAALSYVRGLIQVGARTHRDARMTRRYADQINGGPIDETAQPGFDPYRSAAIGRLTAKAALIQKRFHEARRSGAYGAHDALTGAKSLMTWQEAVAGACTSLSTDAAIAGPAGIAAVMRADPAAG